MTVTPALPNKQRIVIYVSDGTGITALTFGQAVLTQFDLKFTEVRMPFTDTIEKAHAAKKQIDKIAANSSEKPLIFLTLVQNDLREIVLQANGVCTDLMSIVIRPLEEALGVPSNHTVGKHFANDTYKNRIEAINYSLMHDDGQTIQNLDDADILLIGVSRCGKTPTSLYLAMQHCKKVANYPLVPEDLERDSLPVLLKPHKHKIYGLSILPKRLSEIRNERRPGSKYASIENCMKEVANAEHMMKREGILWIDSTAKSIEEISTYILNDKRFA